MTNVIPLEERDILAQRFGEGDAVRWFDGLKLYQLAQRLYGQPDEAGRPISRRRICADYASIAGIPRGSAEARLRQALFYGLTYRQFPTVTWEGFTVAMRLGSRDAALALLREVVASEPDHGGAPTPVDRIEALVIERLRRTPAQTDAEALRRAARAAESVRRIMVKHGGEAFGGWGVDQFVQRAETLAAQIERAERSGTESGNLAETGNSE